MIHAFLVLHARPVKSLFRNTVSNVMHRQPRTVQCPVHPTCTVYIENASYNTRHGYSDVPSCTREFFHNLYDHARQGDPNCTHTSLLLRRVTGNHSADGKVLEDIAYTLNTSKEGPETEVARVQITPTDRGQRTRLAFAQTWDDALDNSHLLLHSTKDDTSGIAGGFKSCRK